MTATLVLGGPRSGKSHHAAALLAHHPMVTVVEALPQGDALTPPPPQGQCPPEWRSMRTLDLTRALLASRHPVLIDDLGGWLRGLLAEDGLARHPDRARKVLDARLDELGVALRAVPFDVVVVSPEPALAARPSDPAGPVEQLHGDLLSHVTRRVSAVSGRVHVLLGGRVLDLSSAPLVGVV